MWLYLSFRIKIKYKTDDKHTHTHTHKHTGLTARFSGTTRVSRYQKGTTNLDFTEGRDSEWQWHQLDHMQVCTSLQTDNHASIPPLSFLQTRCPSCCSTNSVKALKAKNWWQIVWLKSSPTLASTYLNNPSFKNPTEHQTNNHTCYTLVIVSVWSNTDFQISKK